MDPYWYDTMNLDNIHMKYHELIMVGNLNADTSIYNTMQLFLCNGRLFTLLHFDLLLFVHKALLHS